MQIKRQQDHRGKAETLAIQALVYLSADFERLEPFLSLTGLDVGGLRAAAGQEGFLAAVLDYIAGNEKLLLGFAAETELDPAQISRARAALAGPTPDWDS